MKSEQFPFYLIITALFIGIVSPSLFSDGMFMDGVIYAGVSKNLAHNIGSFWNLTFSETLFLHFHEHPPLAMWLQSFFFRLFGDSILIERVYSLLTSFITAFVIVKIWKQISKKEKYSLAWLPLLFMIFISDITWAASNNILENTMIIFTSLSVLYLIKSVENKRLPYLVLAGSMLFLAFLTKGFVSLYILSFFFWVWIFDKEFKLRHFIVKTALLLIFFLLPFILLYLVQPVSIENLLAYVNNQVIGSLNNIVTVKTRFFIIQSLFKELIPSCIIISIAFLITWKTKLKIENKKWIYIFLGLALSGVIPIMISLKQSGFYILTTYPFFCIAFAILIAPRVLKLSSRININSQGYKYFKTISFILIVGSFILASLQVNRIGRDKAMLEDIYTISELIPENTTISIQKQLYSDWTLHAYFYRYYNISLDYKNKHDFFLALKNNKTKELVNYSKMEQKLNQFDLYKKNK